MSFTTQYVRNVFWVTLVEYVNINTLGNDAG